jgi:hypothetical protein
MALHKVSTPAVTPAPVQSPVAVPAPPAKSGKKRWLVLGVIVAGGVALALWQRQAGQSDQARSAIAATRTAPVGQGAIERTLRLTGSTAALRYASLIAPIMRGSRNNSGRGGPSGNFGGGDGGGGMRSSGGGGSRGSGGGGSQMAGGGGFGGGGERREGNRNNNGETGAGTAASSVQAASVSSTSSAMGGSAASSGRNTTAMRSATSRVSSTSRTPMTMATARGSVISSVGSLGNLPGGNNQGGGGGGGTPGGGGGRGDFGLTLQMVSKAGSFVKKGDVVAEFDRETMLQRLDDYKASVDQSEASYRRMQAEMNVTRESHAQSIRTAKGDLEKADLNLKTLPVASSMDAERLRLAREEADAQYRQLNGEVKYVEIGIAADQKIADIELQQTKLEFKRAETNIDRMIVKAPIDGLVVMQPMIRGGEFDQIKQGDQVPPGMGFMQIVDPRDMIVNANVNQVDAEKLRIGLKARVRFDAFPDLELPAHVYAMGTVAKASRSRPDWVKEMAVTLKLDRMDPRVIPDLSVSAEIVLESTEAASTLLPREAVFYDNGKSFVYVRTQGGEFERRAVELGLSSFTQVAVKSGIKAGEVVALEQPVKRESRVQMSSLSPRESRTDFSLSV